MSNQGEQILKEEIQILDNFMTPSASNTQTTKKFPIICKFWMRNICTKDDKCDYLHTEIDKRGYQNFSLSGFNNNHQPSNTTECQNYQLGFCKNGIMCNYKHIKTMKTEEELKMFPELPLWYLEYVFGKPAKLIFEEFERQNSEEVKQLKQKYVKSNRNKYGNISDNRMYNQGMHNFNYKANFNNYHYDIYSDKKDSILESLNQKVRYFFIRNKKMDLVKFSMEYNIILSTKQNTIKFKEAQKSCDDVVFMIFDEEFSNFNGFCKFRKELEEQEISTLMSNNSIFNDLTSKMLTNPQYTSFLKVDWHWKTKLNCKKVELLSNKLNDNELFIDSKDGQEISIDLGYYMCRMMIKRLTREEVKEYMNYKKEHEESSNKNEINKFISLNQNDNTIKHLNSIIYDQLKSKRINDNIHSIQSANRGNNIIVTNISNLQVNISQNNYSCVNDNDKTQKNHFSYKKRQRSESKNSDYCHSKKRSSKKKTAKKVSKKNNYSCNSSLTSIEGNENHYNSDETVVIKEDSYNKKKKDLDSSGENYYETKTSPCKENNETPNKQIENITSLSINEMKLGENKIMKNKLFFNAMEKISHNVFKREHTKLINTNK